MNPLSLFTSTNAVLFFHSVQSKDWFRNTLRAVSRLYKFIPVADVDAYYYNDKKFNNRCHISFDDGDKTFYENAFPVLKEMNIPATLFVSPKIINGRSNYWFQEIEYLQVILKEDLIKESISEASGLDQAKIRKYNLLSILKNMEVDNIFKVISFIKGKYNIDINERFNITKDQLHEAVDSGLITIGAHTMNHPVLSNETDGNAQKEIGDSIVNLSEMLKTEVKYFAYPNGVTGLDYGQREQAILKRNNIRLAFTTDTNFFNRKTDRFVIPRVGFSKGKGSFVLSKLLLLPAWEPLRNIVKPGKSESKVEALERSQIKEALVNSN